MVLFNGHVIFRGKSIVDGIRYSECIELLQWKKYGCRKEIPYWWNPLLFPTRSVLAVLLFLWVFPLGFRLTMAYSIQWLGEECSRYVDPSLHLTKAVEALPPPLAAHCFKNSKATVTQNCSGPDQFCQQKLYFWTNANQLSLCSTMTR